MSNTMPDSTTNSDRSDKAVQALTSAVIAAVSVIAVTILNRRRERPIEAVFDAGMDYQRRLTSREAAAA
jgi:hypothetical protein